MGFALLNMNHLNLIKFSIYTYLDCIISFYIYQLWVVCFWIHVFKYISLVCLSFRHILSISRYSMSHQIWTWFCWPFFGGVILYFLTYSNGKFIHILQCWFTDTGAIIWFQFSEGNWLIGVKLNGDKPKAQTVCINQRKCCICQQLWWPCLTWTTFIRHCLRKLA